MGQYCLRRVAIIIPMMVVVSIIVFVLLRLLPGDVVDALLQNNPSLTQDNRGVIEREYGLDKSLPAQYLDWAVGIVHGDFGESFVSHDSVGGQMKRRSVVTLELAILALGFAWFIGVGLGIVSAVYPDSAVDHVARSVAVLGISLPSFWWATIAVVYPSIWWHISPPTSEISIAADPIGNLKQYLIPAVILGSISAATIARLTRSSLLEVLRSDYIRTARAIGLSERVLLVRHALPNALITVVTVASVLAASLIGGTVVIESIYNLHGLGLYVFTAIGQRDYPVIQSTVFVLSAGVMAINLLADVTYVALDPRIRP